MHRLDLNISGRCWIVSLDVRNLTDEEPPFYNGNTGGISGNATGWGYNGFSPAAFASPERESSGSCSA
jgi:hypothetical protein